MKRKSSIKILTLTLSGLIAGLAIFLWRDSIGGDEFEGVGNARSNSEGSGVVAMSGQILRSDETFEILGYGYVSLAVAEAERLEAVHYRTNLGWERALPIPKEEGQALGYPVHVGESFDHFWKV